MDTNQPTIPETNDLPPTVAGQDFQAPEVPVNVPPVENTPAAVPPTPKQKNKLMPILLIVLILTILGVGGMYAYKNFFVKVPEPTPTPIATPESTPDPTADWETYTNTKRGYSMRYPTDWTVKEVSENRPEFKDKVEYIVFYSPTKDYALTFSIRKKGETVKLTGRTGTSAGDFVDGTPIYINDNVVPVRNLMFENKLKAVFYYQTDTGMFSLDGYEAYADFDRITYDQDNETDLSKSPQLLLLVANQILSTFKFTDENSTVDTSNWKTFSDAQYGIVLKYPENQYTIDNPPKIDCPTPVDDTITRCNLSVIDSCSSFECTDMITITVYLDPNDPTYKSNLNDLSGAFSSSKIVDSNIDGIPVKMRTYPDAQQIVIAQIYYLTTSKHSYIIYGKPNDPTFNKIISTLKISK